MPAPGKYKGHSEWTSAKELVNNGLFSKRARVTFTEGIMKDPINKLQPGPNTYKMPLGHFDNGVSKKPH